MTTTWRARYIATGSLVLAIAALWARMTWAGFSGSKEVLISSTSASGSLKGARKSSDTNQTIGCKLMAKGSSVEGMCMAIDKANTEVNCKVINQSWFPLIAMVNESSHIEFTFTAKTGADCTSLAVINTSQNLP